VKLVTCDRNVGVRVEGIELGCYAVTARKEGNVGLSNGGSKIVAKHLKK
jgi:hypothetical protein